MGDAPTSYSTQLRQLAGRDPPRLVARQQLRRRSSPWFIFEIDIGECLSAVVADFLDCAGRFCGSSSPVMKTVAEYRAYAAESRRLVASVLRSEDKQALEKLARAWERLADEREARLLKQIDGDTLID